jgi:AraC family transcriptional regulator of adaptative response / DNA-3-methyladenine glycosylase II
VRRALRLIQEGALDEGTVDELALRVGIGSRHLDRLFTEHVGVSPIAVAQTRRLHFAKQLLDETDLPITQIAMTAGFGSVRRFNEAYQTTFRCTPRETRQRRQTDPAPMRDEQVSLTLSYRPPYDWDSLATFLSRRAISGVERVDASGYERTIRVQHGYAHILVAPMQGSHALRLQVSRAEPNDLFEIATTARRVFDLTADPVAIADVLSADPMLVPLAARRPGLRVPGVWGTFECAVRGVLGQRCSVSFARLLAERLVQRFGGRIGAASNGLTHVFPTPEKLVNANLNGIGLTAPKIAGLHAIARAVLDGTVNLSAQADEVVKALNELPGVGNWTAQYVALRALGEPDAFPCSDLVVRRATAGVRSTLSIEAMRNRAEEWRPWRGYATLHLWQRDGEADSKCRPLDSERMDLKRA